MGPNMGLDEASALEGLPEGLLPEGLRDVLPGEADARMRLVRAMMDRIAAHGYARVAPPLAEFEEGLGARLKSSRAQDLIRVVDPVSQRTLALRPDITPQISRIAATRMAHAPRPLRLAYAGPVLRLRARELDPTRERFQLGAELIGVDTPAAACEIVLVAIEALNGAGVDDLTLDLAIPDLVDLMVQTPEFALSPGALGPLKAALDAKDAGALSALGLNQWQILVEAVGPVDRALQCLRSLAGLAGMPEVQARFATIAAVAAAAEAHGVRVTLDPGELHGFAYQSGFGFTLFAETMALPLARGGAYVIDHAGDRSGDLSGNHPVDIKEPAVGFSIFPDPLVGQDEAKVQRLFLPLGTPYAVARKLRQEGWTTVGALTPGCAAKALGCTHFWDGTAACPVSLSE